MLLFRFQVFVTCVRSNPYSQVTNVQDLRDRQTAYSQRTVIEPEFPVGDENLSDEVKHIFEALHEPFYFLSSLNYGSGSNQRSTNHTRADSNRIPVLGRAMEFRSPSRLQGG